MGKNTIRELLHQWQREVEAAAPPASLLSELDEMARSERKTSWERYSEAIAALLSPRRVVFGDAKVKGGIPEARKWIAEIPSSVLSEDDLNAVVRALELKVKSNSLLLTGRINVPLITSAETRVRFISLADRAELFSAVPKFWSPTEFLVEHELPTFLAERWRKLGGEVPFGLLFVGARLKTEEGTPRVSGEAKLTA